MKWRRILPAPALISVLLVCGVAAADPVTPSLPGPPGAGTPAVTVSSAAGRLEEGSPVRLGEKTLFRIQARIGSFSAGDRASALESRLKGLSQGPIGLRPTITLQPQAATTDILAGDTVLLTVTEADAAAAGLPREETAERYARAMQDALSAEQEHRSVKSFLLGLVSAFACTIALAVILWSFARLFPATVERIRRSALVRPIRIQNLELLSAGRVANGLVSLTRFVRVAATVLLFYVYVALLFGFFPRTRGFSKILLYYTFTPLRTAWTTFLDYLPNLFSLAVVIVLAYYFNKAIRLLFTEVSRGTISIRGFEREWATPTYKIARFAIVAFAAVVAFPYLPGSGSPAFKGVSIFLGILFSLSSSSAISNIVAGVILTYTGAFRLGDRLTVADTTGDVIEKTLLVTRIRTIKNVEVTIPNAMVLSSHIVNYSASAQETGLILHTSVTIGYSAPWRQVHELLIAAARATEGVLKDPAPFVLQTSLDDFYVHYEINAYTSEPQRMIDIYSDLHRNIQDRFNEANVEIMSPHYGALRDGNQVTVPANHLPKSYEAPPFRILAIDPPGGAKPTGGRSGDG